MQFAKPFGLVVFVLMMLLPERVALASPGRSNSEKAKAEKSEKKDENPVHSVPEPRTLVLLGAAAGVVGARKLSQDRRRARSVSGDNRRKQGFYFRRLGH